MSDHDIQLSDGSKLRRLPSGRWGLEHIMPKDQAELCTMVLRLEPELRAIAAETSVDVEPVNVRVLLDNIQIEFNRLQPE